MKSWKAHYSHFLKGHEGYLHLCAHSHHFWPDVSRAAQMEAWDDAARLSDRKWDVVLGEVLPAVQQGIAARLGLRDSSRLTFASNTHEHLLRLLSCFEEMRPLRILSTDSEFHSFRRQASRLRESGLVSLEIVPQFPRETFAERFLDAAERGDFDVVFVSHVFFNSGGVLPQAESLLGELKARTRMLVLDAYHSFLARPFSLGAHQDDLYVLGGAYKYLQGGEGACFLYTPPKADALRPQNTGWFAHFAGLDGKPGPRTDYGSGAWRFWGSTFDPSALYRLRAVLRFLTEQGLSDQVIHEHSLALQARALEVLASSRGAWQRRLSEVVPQMLPASERGNFLSFPLASGEARRIQDELAHARILSDSRESGTVSYLRFGLGLYHDAADMDRLA